MPDAKATTRELQGELDTALAGLIEPGTEVAYVNFPNIGNLGDSAIYVGGRAALRRAGARVALVCEHRGYRRALIRKAVGERGTIVIHGGANFGDLYWRQPQQSVRRKLLRDFPRARIIQLPQTVYFERERRARRFARLCAAHEDLTLMVRDRPSVERLGALGLEAILCPDLAFGLGPLERPAAPSLEISWVVREDVEGRHEPRALHPEARDWPTGQEQRRGETGARLRRELALARALLTARDRWPRPLRMPLARANQRLYGSIARQRLSLALEMIARGRLVVTDRFHGHLLACLMGIPSVLLDNSYGKNRGLYETWTHRYAIARFAEGPDGVDDLARELMAA